MERRKLSPDRRRKRKEKALVENQRGLPAPGGLFSSPAIYLDGEILLYRVGEDGTKVPLLYRGFPDSAAHSNYKKQRDAEILREYRAMEAAQELMLGDKEEAATFHSLIEERLLLSLSFHERMWEIIKPVIADYIDITDDIADNEVNIFVTQQETANGDPEIEISCLTPNGRIIKLIFFLEFDIQKIRVSLHANPTSNGAELFTLSEDDFENTTLEEEQFRLLLFAALMSGEPVKPLEVLAELWYHDVEKEAESYPDFIAEIEQRLEAGQTPFKDISEAGDEEDSQG